MYLQHQRALNYWIVTDDPQANLAASRNAPLSG
jgi:hypothetical protein